MEAKGRKYECSVCPDHSFLLPPASSLHPQWLLSLFHLIAQWHRCANTEPSCLSVPVSGEISHQETSKCSNCILKVEYRSVIGNSLVGTVQVVLTLLLLSCTLIFYVVDSHSVRYNTATPTTAMRIISIHNAENKRLHSTFLLLNIPQVWWLVSENGKPQTEEKAGLWCIRVEFDCHLNLCML